MNLEQDREKRSFLSKKISLKACLALTISVALAVSAISGALLIRNDSHTVADRIAMLQKIQAVSSLTEKTVDNLSGTTVADNTAAGAMPITQIAKKIGPSIVGIRMTVADSIERYFNEDAQGSRTEGSGIIISKDGYIMTNYHVVAEADPRKSNDSSQATLEVFLPDKRQAKARFIGGDALNDIAVIKIDLKNLPAAELGDSSKLQVGELAVAIGNPLGMEFMGSVTSGVISALNRSVNTGDRTLNLVQTDAAINPGNSGGALVNGRGQVIGMNTAKIAVSGVEGLGFAIPINTAKPIASQLIMFGYVKGRPLVGLSGQEVSAAIAQYYRLAVGIYVTDVTPGGGAAKAGIHRGDIVVSMAGRRVQTMKDIDNIKRNYKAGDTVNVVVVRNRQRLTLKLTFTEDR
ncbi:MAG TPA: trypsin-like peptidase domain-containing protein [Bacillota bacterium]|nr:trypsin-like peptidase domain-containing protein [Bacillota bacterium]